MVILPHISFLGKNTTFKIFSSVFRNECKSSKSKKQGFSPETNFGKSLKKKINMLIKAGIDPDAVPVLPARPADPTRLDDVIQDMEVDPRSKKQMPSGSPDGKLWDQSGSDDDGDDEELNELNDSRKSKEEWMLKKRGKEPRLPTKREQKRARKLERAKANKMT